MLDEHAKVNNIQGDVCTARYYGSRDMCRRVYFCYKSFLSQRLLPDSVVQFFSAYQNSTLHRMFAFCSQGGAPGPVSVTDPHGWWVVPADFVANLKDWLSEVLTHRSTRPTPSRTHPLVVFSYMCSIMDKIDLQAALHDPAAIQPLTAAQRSNIPTVAFRYDYPLGRKFCNHARLAQCPTLTQQAPCCGN